MRLRKRVEQIEELCRQIQFSFGSGMERTLKGRLEALEGWKRTIDAEERRRLCTHCCCQPKAGEVLFGQWITYDGKFACCKGCGYFGEKTCHEKKAKP